MNIFLLLAIAMALIVLLLRLHYPIGPSMLLGGLLIWLVRDGSPLVLFQAALHTLSLSRTYDIILALYFVMCLEIELRTSGAMEGMVHALQRLFASAKVTLAVMPAFLGLLPSLGGARFSAPIVDEASKGEAISENRKAAINFWFRHIFEFSNPIIPGMIIACSIVNVPYKDFISHICWLTPVTFSVGWLVLIRGLDMRLHKALILASPQNRRKELADLLLSLSPVVVTFILVVFFGLNASLGMGLVTLGLLFLLRCCGRNCPARRVLLDALDWKMFLNVLCILYFIQILTDTQVLSQVVEAFQDSPLPVPVIIACVSFIIGILTGMSQGHVAIVMPVVAALRTGDLNLVGVAMAFGVAGQMLTPTHMCLIVTLDYFKADFFATLKQIFLIEVIVLTIFSLVSYFTW